MSTLIKGGTIVTASDTYQADVLIDGEKIVTIGHGLSADTTIDATGKYVIPGGIDVHTHLDMPIGATLRETLDIWHGKASGKAAVDYGFHVAITDLPQSVMDEIKNCPDYGVTSLKLFMAYKGALMVDDATLFKAMQQAAEHGLLIMVHAENGDAIDILETEATERGNRLSEVAGSPLYAVHVTNAGAMEAIRDARARGRSNQIFGETCTQYFFFTKDDLAREGFEGAKWVCSPPYREKYDQEALWGAVASNALQVVSTDHCPFWYEGGKDGKTAGKELGKDNFAAIPNGCPGIEDRMMVLYTAGVRGGRFSLNRWVELCCTNPAKLFGCYPQKGTIAPGADADVVVWDPNATYTITAAQQHQNTDYNLYEGMEVTGMPSVVLSRGRVLVQDGEWKGEQGAGKFVKRNRFKV